PLCCLFFPLDPPTSAISTLSLHDALPILGFAQVGCLDRELDGAAGEGEPDPVRLIARHDAHAPQGRRHRRLVRGRDLVVLARDQDRKSTRLNSSHLVISYAVFCLKKKKKL